MTFTISLEDNATPAVMEMLRRSKDRTELHRAMGMDVRENVRNYVLTDSPDRHETADRLGATHSGFVGKAANAVQLAAVTNESVTVSLNHSWFARAFGDVTITPSKTYLTIPLIAAAYNQRAPTVSGLFFWTNPKTGKSFLASALKAPGIKGTLELWYLLLKIVHQAQDRTRIPTDEALGKTAITSASVFYTKLLEDLRARRVAQAKGTP